MDKYNETETEWNGLPLCSKCGWSKVMPHSDCKPAAGKAAKQLVKTLRTNGIEATMHGYGESVAFHPFKGLTVVLGVARNGKEFQISHVYGFHDMDEERVLTLAEQLKKIWSVK